MYGSYTHMLQIGIVGFPNVGKSTLFKAHEKTNRHTNYPFTTIDPNVGVVAVPDERLEKLAKLTNSKKIIPTAIEFIDIVVRQRRIAGRGFGQQVSRQYPRSGRHRPCGTRV